MSFIEELKERITKGSYLEFLKFWEDFCFTTDIDPQELKKILDLIKSSDFVEPFGKHVTKALSPWREIIDPALRHEIIKLIFDIQNANTEELAEIAYNYLCEKYPNDPMFDEKIRLIGLKARENFQSAISNYELLTHIDKGKFVFHTAGWGTGEILDYSLVREDMTLEFDFVVGPKHLSFANALKTLIPIPDNHFLAKRFGQPDQLEKEAKENPEEVIYLLLKDLGPKNAAEIREELYDLVIPTKEWNKWWQNARSKIKKDFRFIFPSDQKSPFRLRLEEMSQEESLYKSLETKPGIENAIQMVHSYFRNFPKAIKNADLRNTLSIKLRDLLAFPDLTDAQKIQILFLLYDLSPEKDLSPLTEIIQKIQAFPSFFQAIAIPTFKKRLLLLIREQRQDWQDIFFQLFFSLAQNPLRDFLFNELQKEAPSELLQKKIEELLSHPLIYPYVFVWYFQKVINDSSRLPFSDMKGKCRFFENFLILLDHLDQKPEHRDLSKKMVHLLIADRYKIVRHIMEISSLEEVKEFLLLSTKCRLLSDHDIKIIHSLAYVVYSSLKQEKILKKEKEIIWATSESFEHMKEKILHLANVEIIENAREIEEARSHGDLRENAEYKAALEKRQRLQTELQFLTSQMNKARILTKDLVSVDKVNIGTIVRCISEEGNERTFTILGTWDSLPEKDIVSDQSQLAKSILGLSIGDRFRFQEEVYTIRSIANYFDEK